MMNKPFYPYRANINPFYPYKVMSKSDPDEYKKEWNRFFHDLHQKAYLQKLLNIYSVDRWQKATRTQRSDRNDIYNTEKRYVTNVTTEIFYYEDVPYIKLLWEKIPNMEQVLQHQYKYHTEEEKQWLRKSENLH